MTASRGKPRRILVIKTQAIGDLLMTTPALRELRQAHPSAHIALMTGNWSAPAVKNNPHLDEIIGFDDRILLERQWGGMARLLLRLRREKFDAAVIFHPSPFLHLFAWLAGIPVRYGLLRGTRNLFLTAGVREDLGPSTYYPVNFQRVTALAGAIPGEPSLEVHETPEDRSEADALLRKHGVGAGDKFIVVAPGGGRNSKEDVAARRWPAERFAELLKALRETRPELKVLLTGAAGDAAETSLIAAAVPECIDLTAQTGLPQIYALVRRAQAVLCNDSSLLHIAVACGKPAVAPFGPTGLLQRLPEWAAPFSIQSGIGCSPCYVGGLFPGCGIGFACMREITAGEMALRVEKAISVSTAAS